MLLPSFVVASCLLLDVRSSVVQLEKDDTMSMLQVHVNAQSSDSGIDKDSALRRLIMAMIEFGNGAGAGATFLLRNGSGSSGGGDDGSTGSSTGGDAGTTFLFRNGSTTPTSAILNAIVDDVVAAGPENVEVFRTRIQQDLTEADLALDKLKEVIFEVGNKTAKAGALLKYKVKEMVQLVDGENAANQAMGNSAKRFSVADSHHFNNFAAEMLGIAHQQHGDWVYMLRQLNTTAEVVFRLKNEVPAATGDTNVKVKLAGLHRTFTVQLTSIRDLLFVAKKQGLETKVARQAVGKIKKKLLTAQHAMESFCDETLQYQPVLARGIQGMFGTLLEDLQGTAENSVAKAVEVVHILHNIVKEGNVDVYESLDIMIKDGKDEEK